MADFFIERSMFRHKKDGIILFLSHLTISLQRKDYMDIIVFCTVHGTFEQKILN